MPNARPDPKPCREQDLGLFEVTSRDGWARQGKLHTAHGILKTPAILPVVNPNILTISPREMWDKYGFEGLITNSYIIWKKDELKEQALESGVHELLDYPGVIMTDSGTFQSYIYGDVEVSNKEIVSFQHQIGVDIATMLDVFTRPDMTTEEWKSGVEETAKRASEAIESASGTLLNGPIQGGLDIGLRKKSVQLMSEHPFSVHPIGGIVPLMEEQRYEELFQIISSIRRDIPPERPVHMFGCGHPMLFPFAIALGVDLFDSAAYVLFARDDRLLTPVGTVHLEKLQDWTHVTPSLFGITPEEVRALGDEERCALLSRANLEVTLAEIARCRQAIKEGRIWELAELRSHCNPDLRLAWESVITERKSEEKTPLVDLQNLQRSGGIRFMADSVISRPDLEKVRQTLAERWKAPPVSGWNGKGKRRKIVVFTNAEPPWRMSVGEVVKRMLIVNPAILPMIATPMGLLPYSLEDINPFAHLSYIRSDSRHNDEIFIQSELERFGLGKSSWEIHESCTTHQELIDEDEYIHDVEQWIHQWSAVDKLALFANLDYGFTWEEITGAKMVMSRTRRVKNILTKEGVHIASPRLTDGGLSITLDGAKWINNLPKSKPKQLSGPAKVVVNNDAEPFVRQGRSVFHGFCITSDQHLYPGQPCLILNESGDLIGHGVSRVDAEELLSLQKGIAIKVRDGLKNE